MTYEKPRWSRRFDIQLPVTLLALGERTVHKKARTRNISSSGMFVELDAGAAPGTPVELILDLPPEITRCNIVRVSCKGCVVRCERTSPTRTGIAVSIDRYQFERPHSDDGR